jgi:hypothetical protein
MVVTSYVIRLPVSYIANNNCPLTEAVGGFRAGLRQQLLRVSDEPSHYQQLVMLNLF